jgi:hypothetical protein
MLCWRLLVQMWQLWWQALPVCCRTIACFRWLLTCWESRQQPQGQRQRWAQQPQQQRRQVGLRPVLLVLVMQQRQQQQQQGQQGQS